MLLPVALFFDILFILYPSWSVEAVMSLFLCLMLIAVHLLRREEEGGK